MIERIDNILDVKKTKTVKDEKEFFCINDAGNGLRALCTAKA
jgi:hypothetical protein